MELINEEDISINSIIPDILLLSEKTLHESFIIIKSKRIIVNSSWQILINSNADILGYHISVILQELLSDTYQYTQVPEDNKQECYFHYNNESNGYYQSYELKLDSYNSSIIGSYNNINANPCLKEDLTKPEIDIDDLPKFYSDLYKVIKFLAENTGDYSMIDLLKGKHSLSKNITLYRIIGSNIIRVDEYSDLSQVQTWNDEMSNQRRKESKDNQRVLQVTLKNKSYIENVLLSIPIPRKLILIIIICILTMCLSVTLSITQFIIYSHLLSKTRDQIKEFFLYQIII